jgi:tetratricopeptide (TPR) repeat protein
MPTDRYGNALATDAAAAAHYIVGVDALFSANVGAQASFEAAIAQDPDFALAHAALARTHQVFANREAAKASIGHARDLASRLVGREASHVAALGLVLDGQGPAALAAIKTHLESWPRDAMALSPCVGVFGLYGFSGNNDRAAQLRDLLDGLADAYGEDWWFLAMQAFAHVETGSLESARGKILRALALNPRDAHGAHIQTHVHYEAGETQDGQRLLAAFVADYPREGLLHCHIQWHRALWALAADDFAGAFAIYDANIAPGALWGPAVNVVTDAASFLMRASLRGATPPPGAWDKVLAHGKAEFPRAGLAFVDVHMALAAAMTGDTAECAARATGTRGPAQPMVALAAEGFSAFAKKDWPRAIEALGAVLPEHERFGGSLAQRDLIEEMLAVAHKHAGRAYASQRKRRVL